MTTQWKNGAPFQKHNEYIRQFRLAHAIIAWSNKPKCEELTRLSNMPCLQVSYNVIETGGARLISNARNLPALSIIPKMATYKITLN